ncbi:MAG: glycosyltransferase [Thermoanaerobaculia bacterium]
MQRIQSLWIGTELSVMERLSITSFLANGHPYELYVYDNVKGIPDGTVVKDANRILPAAAIFKYRSADSYAGFANHFRYKLLLEEGGWWADTDVVCVKPFTFDDEYVIASEMSDSGREAAATCVIKAPCESELMQFALETCRSKNPRDLEWGETGPALMEKAVRKLQLDRYRKSYRTFCPVSHAQWRWLLEPGADSPMSDDTVAIHLWNELWRRAAQDKDAEYAASSIYEQLKSRYLPVRDPTASMNASTPNGEESLRERLAAAERTIRDLRVQLDSEREGSRWNAQLMAVENELQSIHRSRGWKLLTWLRRVKYFFLARQR